MDKLASRSVSNEEFVLDVPFSVEEAARKLKGSKAAGPDGLKANRLYARLNGMQLTSNAEID